jgi:hypothetical protein
MDKAKTLFKDPVVPTSSGKSDFEDVTLIKGDFEVNGQKVVIGMGLHECIVDPEG